MKKFSKMFGVVLAIAMLLTCLPAQFAFAEEAVNKLEDYPETALAFDVSSEKNIKDVSLVPETGITNEKAFSAKWDLSDSKQAKLIRFEGVKDLSAYETIEFYMYGDPDNTAEVMFYIDADDPNASGIDYYGGEKFKIKAGWNKYSFSISKLYTKKTRNPLPISAVNGLMFRVDGWGLQDIEANQKAVLYFDEIVLKRGTSFVGEPAAKKEETDAGTKRYLDVDFEAAEVITDVSGIGATPKTNKIEVVKDSDSKKSYAKVEKTGTDSDCFIDVSLRNTSRYLVISADLMTTKVDGTVNAFILRDSNKATNKALTLKSDATLSSYGKILTTMKPGEWVNVALCFDFDNKLCNAYLNNKLTFEDLTISDMQYPNLFRCSLMGASIPVGTNLCIDNLRVFDGKTPEDYEKSSGASAPKPGEALFPGADSDYKPEFVEVARDAVADVKNAVCLKVNCPTALVRHEQVFIDENNKSVAPMIVNSRTLVPVRFIAEAFGAEVGWDDATRTVTVKKDSDTLELVIGTNIIKKNGTDITIDVPAAIYNDRTMLPLRAVTENLGKKVFWDDMGLIIIDDKEYTYTKDKDLNKMIDIIAGITVQRPSREQIKADILKTTPNHPRVYATEADFERIRNLASTDEAMQTWVSAISKKADKYVATAGNEELADYAYDAGGRLANSNAVGDKGKTLGLMYKLTGDKKYVDAMWKTLEVMCNRERWSNWGAGHFLNAADVMEGIAVAYDWMYDAWTPEQKTIIEDALYDCAIEDGITAFHGANDFLQPPMGVWQRSQWGLQGSNWNGHCNGGIMLAGAAMATHEKYGDLAVKAMEYAMRSLEVGTRCYAPDGAYPEGVSYWAYGTSGVVKALNTLQLACGSKNAYGLVDAAGLDNSWINPIYLESKQGSFNFSDTSVSRTDTSLLMWFGNTYNKPEVSGLRFNEIYNASGEAAEKAADFLDVIWYQPEKIGNAAATSLDKSFYIIDTVTMRSSWTDQNQLFVGLHGGSNSANHAHNDSGVFILDALNTRWFMDLGSDNYNLPGYFGGGQRLYYRLRAEGHNVYVINPDTSAGQVTTATARLVENVSKPRGAYAKLDLTTSYQPHVNKAVRGVMMTANRKAVVIQDEIEMKAPSEFYWFAHIGADTEATISEDGKSVVLSKQAGAKQLYGKIVSDNSDFKFELADANPLPTSPQSSAAENSRAGIRKLVIKGTGLDKVNLAVAFAPAFGGVAPEYEYTYTKLDDWSIPDGEILVPKLEGITVGGEQVKGFNKDVTSYELVLPYGSTAFPEIVATPDALSTCEVTSKPETLPGTAQIKVVNKEDPLMYSVYSVFARAASEVEIEVSDAQEGNPGSQCLDGKLETRWAVEGESWGIFRFANPKEVSTVRIATWKAAARQLIFDIEVSEDGENFKQVWSGKTTATEDVLEDIAIPAGTYKAIKLVLHGTTAGAWNSILEVEFK